MGQAAMKVVDLQPGVQSAIESGIPGTGDIAVLFTDVYGNPVVHKSGVPAVGDTVLVGTDEKGNQVAIKSGTETTDPLVDLLWTDETGQYIYFFYHHFLLAPFYSSSHRVLPKTCTFYQTEYTKSRRWILAYVDIRMHGITEPFPDLYVVDPTLEGWLWGQKSYYHEFSKTFSSDYYTPSVWNTVWWHFPIGDDSTRMITTVNTPVNPAVYPDSGYVTLWNAGYGNFGAMCVGNRPSAFINDRYQFRNSEDVRRYGSKYVSMPKMFTTEPIPRVGYPVGRMELEYNVSEFLRSDPDQNYQDFYENNAVVPIKTIGDYSDSAERSDRWGTVWSYGYWNNFPAIAYHNETNLISPDDMDYGYGNINYVPDDMSRDSLFHNKVSIRPFSFTTPSAADITTFPDRGFVILSSLRNDIGTNEYNATKGRQRQFGIYEGKSGASLQNVQVCGWPANRISHPQPNPYGWISYYYTYLLDRFARVEFTHHIRSGPHRITHIKFQSVDGWAGVIGGPMISISWAHISKIKIADGIDEMEVPTSGHFIYVGKHATGPNAGKIFEMQLYYYTRSGSWLTPRTRSYKDVVSNVSQRDPNVSGLIYKTGCSTTFLGILLNGGWPTYDPLHGLWEPSIWTIEIPTDNADQGYIYIVDEVSSPHTALRFYHDDEFHGVQVPLAQTTSVASIIRVVSTNNTTYILYKWGTGPVGSRSIFAVKLPSPFYTDYQYNPGRFPLVWGNDIDIPSPNLMIMDISCLREFLVMYISDTTQTV
jgi:hypothetical protein